MKNLILILIVIPALITGACAVTATAEEEYYTWVDENGITNYSERNPEGVNATFVSRNQAFGRRAAEEGRPKPQAQLPQNDTPVVDPDALVNEQAAAIAAEISEIKRKNCEIGKSNLAQIKAFSRIRISDEQGENRILTDEEKEARGDKARGTIRENCTG
ncbi:MAG: hypothetical protein ACJAYE_003151 [Candidatus Azotimanducaceae bacterium]|jgi:hypothetical protein